MNAGAAFVFDPDTENGLRALWQVLADAGLSSYMLEQVHPPHMTMWIAEAFDMPAMRATLEALAAATKPLPVTFTALGVFPGEEGVVFLAPIIGPRLVDLHARFWAEAESAMRSPISYYAPHQWVPHVTLGYNLPPGVLGAAVEALVRAPWPRAALINGVIFGEVGGKGMVEAIRFSGQA